MKPVPLPNIPQPFPKLSPEEILQTLNYLNSMPYRFSASKMDWDPRNARGYNYQPNNTDQLKDCLAYFGIDIGKRWFINPGLNLRGQREVNQRYIDGSQICVAEIISNRYEIRQAMRDVCSGIRRRAPGGLICPLFELATRPHFSEPPLYDEKSGLVFYEKCSNASGEILINMTYAIPPKMDFSLPHTAGICERVERFYI